MGLVRRIRLLTGMVLFAYVCTHLANLSLGLVSLEVMDAWRPAILSIWQNPVGLVVLYGAAACHMLLGLEALLGRRTLRMSGFDTLQLLMALALPPLLVLHVLGTRVVSGMAPVEASYAWLMLIYWKWSPLLGLRQVAVLVAAWIHGCMGIWTWMRVQPWWLRASRFLYPVVFVVPVAALLGFVEGGKDALALAADPEWLARLRAAASPDRATVAKLYAIERGFLWTYGALLAATLALRLALHRRRSESVAVRYLDGPQVEFAAGLSLLEGSRLHEVPHAGLCGGRGRCGTCRVRIVEGGERLPPAQAPERALLDRLGQGAEVRLACQVIAPPGRYAFERLVPADILAEDLYPDGAAQPAVVGDASQPAVGGDAAEARGA